MNIDQLLSEFNDLKKKDRSFDEEYEFEKIEETQMHGIFKKELEENIPNGLW